MKTSKTILSLALIALTSSLFARIAEPEANCSCCPTEVEVVVEQDMAERLSAASYVRAKTWFSEDFGSHLQALYSEACN